MGPYLITPRKYPGRRVIVGRCIYASVRMILLGYAGVSSLVGCIYASVRMILLGYVGVSSLVDVFRLVYV